MSEIVRAWTRGTHSTSTSWPSDAYGLNLFLILIVSTAWLRLLCALRAVALTRRCERLSVMTFSSSSELLTSVEMSRGMTFPT